MTSDARRFVLLHASNLPQKSHTAGLADCGYAVEFDCKPTRGEAIGRVAA